jgi:hypothetical protein
MKIIWYYSPHEDYLEWLSSSCLFEVAHVLRIILEIDKRLFGKIRLTEIIWSQTSIILNNKKIFWSFQTYEVYLK